MESDRRGSEACTMICDKESRATLISHAFHTKHRPDNGEIDWLSLPPSPPLSVELSHVRSALANCFNAIEDELTIF